ncbi:hypothetical protein [Microbulbifer sp. VAAF005]|uniref:hypothetical protein n=1 Tax=Microbulbifer sp. VAAF005 TaxID=3034230 RepID=UPI0024AE2739|nr:hypothetical protein [Microbulbifer sp. VAAF005]WHI46409.1 hypothetical protein P0078_22310 [Microbulbifer sp. VAAF005]
MNRLAILTYFLCASAFGYDTTLLHVHELKLKGVLPEPYKEFFLEIELDENTDNVRIFNLRVGDEQIKMPAAEMKKLKDVNLGSLRTEYGMFGHVFPDVGDRIYIRMSVGDSKYIECKGAEGVDGKRAFDTILIDIKPGSPIEVTSETNYIHFIGSYIPCYRSS